MKHLPAGIVFVVTFLVALAAFRGIRASHKAQKAHRPEPTNAHNWEKWTNDVFIEYSKYTNFAVSNIVLIMWGDADASNFLSGQQIVDFTSKDWLFETNRHGHVTMKKRQQKDEP